MAYVAEAIKQKIVRMEYVDFSELLPLYPIMQEDYTRVYINPEGSISRKIPGQYQNIDSFLA